MAETLTPELREAQQIAGTAKILAIIALVVIATTIAVEGGFRVGAALFSSELTWREHTQDIGLVLISLLPSFLFYESINQLRQALQLYCDGQFFSAAAASKVAQAGDYAIAAMIAMILVVPNLLLWVSHRGGFDLRWESGFIGMFAFAFFVSAVGRILSAATQLKSENDAFV